MRKPTMQSRAYKDRLPNPEYNIITEICTIYLFSGVAVPEPLPAGPSTTPPSVTSSPKPLPLTPSSQGGLPTTPDSEQSGSTRLHPEERHELRQLLTKYVPREVIRKSIWDKFSLDIRQTVRRTFRSTSSLGESQIYRDGGPPTRDDQRMRRAVTTSHLPEETAEEKGDELEWVVLQPSVTDSGTCSASASGSSLDDSLDIDIGDLSKHSCSKKYT